MSTSCCDDSLDINSGLLQEINGEAATPSRARPGHAGLPRHHGDGSGLDGPDTRHRLVVWSAARTPETHKRPYKLKTHTDVSVTDTSSIN